MSIPFEIKRLYRPWGTPFNEISTDDTPGRHEKVFTTLPETSINVIVRIKGEILAFVPVNPIALVERSGPPSETRLTVVELVAGFGATRMLYPPHPLIRAAVDVIF